MFSCTPIIYLETYLIYGCLSMVIRRSRLQLSGPSQEKFRGMDPECTYRGRTCQLRLRLYTWKPVDVLLQRDKRVREKKKKEILVCASNSHHEDRYNIRHRDSPLLLCRTIDSNDWPSYIINHLNVCPSSPL